MAPEFLPKPNYLEPSGTQPALVSKKGPTEFSGPGPKLSDPTNEPAKLFHLPEVIRDPDSLDGLTVLVKSTGQRVVNFGYWLEIYLETFAEYDPISNRLAKGFNSKDGPVHSYLEASGLLREEQTAAQNQPVTGEAGQPVAAEGSQAAQTQVK